MYRRYHHLFIRRGCNLTIAHVKIVKHVTISLRRVWVEGPGFKEP